LRPGLIIEHHWL